MDDVLNDSMRNASSVHKDAIVKELQRRHEKKKQEMKKKREEEEARRLRKEKRAALRERHRISLLKERIDAEIINTAAHEEYKSSMNIYDIRDPNNQGDGVNLIGGFIGELLITFSTLQEIIMSNPTVLYNFVFTRDMVEAFL